jgi:protein-L-isoaspartate O-methyltransferase
MNNLKDGSRQETMVQQQVIERGIHDERVIAALREIPRDRFFQLGMVSRSASRTSSH